MEISKLQNGALVYGLYQKEEDETVYKTVCKVKGYDPFNNFMWVESQEGIEDFISFEPIPLTEEWLIKFGFDKRESSVCDAFYIGINPITKDWLFDIVWLKNMMDYSYEGFPFYRNGHHKIQYVHQLQNLYFALTGEELQTTP
jgi:hypothetical protein